jgi:hypothetical protein
MLIAMRAAKLIVEMERAESFERIDCIVRAFQEEQAVMRKLCVDSARCAKDTPCCEVHRDGPGHCFDCPEAIADRLSTLPIE